MNQSTSLDTRFTPLTPMDECPIHPVRFEPFTFELPPELEASEPPEARGMRLDQVRLLVSYRSEGRIVHDQFWNLPRFLEAGEVLVINIAVP